MNVTTIFFSFSLSCFSLQPPISNIPIHTHTHFTTPIFCTIYDLHCVVPSQRWIHGKRRLELVYLVFIFAFFFVLSIRFSLLCMILNIAWRATIYPPGGTRVSFFLYFILVLQIHTHIDICYFRWRWIALLALRYVYDLGWRQDGVKIMLIFGSNMGIQYTSHNIYASRARHWFRSHNRRSSGLDSECYLTVM